MPEASTRQKRNRSKDKIIGKQLTQLIVVLETYYKFPVESDSEGADDELVEVEYLLHSKKSKLESPKASGERPAQPIIQYEEILRIKPEPELKHKLNAAKELGKTEHWPSKGLYDDLKVLDHLIQKNVGVLRRQYLNGFSLIPQDNAPTRRL
ncbi:hypothetical protein AAF712_013586 [Marasmius tenuissimus]|uniref:Uncharacterized protein n=1 Tax=Marasmius tenuissimus TaxID=585030 RepID=A0ABR2ZED8_9AGAR